MSSVHAVEEARKKHQAAEQKAQIAEEQVKMVKKSAANDVKKIRKQIEKEVKEIEEKARFWKICFIIIVVLIFLCVDLNKFFGNTFF